MAFIFTPDEIYPTLKYLADRTKAAMTDTRLAQSFYRDYRVTPQGMYEYIRDEVEPAFLEARAAEHKVSTRR